MLGTQRAHRPCVPSPERPVTSMSLAAQALAADRFVDEILPALTPIALDPAHPLPRASARSAAVAVRFRSPPRPGIRYGLVLIAPAVDPSLRIVDGDRSFDLPLLDLVVRHADLLFCDATIEACWEMRASRTKPPGRRPLTRPRSPAARRPHAASRSARRPSLTSAVLSFHTRHAPRYGINAR